MNIPLEMIKKLRRETSAGMLDCKEALDEAKGDFQEAKKILRKKGIKIALKKGKEKTSEGVISSYIHHNQKIGVLVEIRCQSDFVAKNAQFQEFTKDIAMHIAALNPKWISVEEIPEKVIKEEKTILKTQIKGEKPAPIIEKIIKGRLEKFYKEVCLLNQPFIKDEKISVKDYLQQLIAKMGENIKIQRFVRFELGEVN
ncbi:elongation factor Ts [Candidatus Aerophobetes bacterium]|nr:elongation factor Ts [Candidatus Aerophobetes bacterium]